MREAVFFLTLIFAIMLSCSEKEEIYDNEVKYIIENKSGHEVSILDISYASSYGPDTTFYTIKTNDSVIIKRISDDDNFPQPFSLLDEVYVVFDDTLKAKCELGNECKLIQCRYYSPLVNDTYKYTLTESDFAYFLSNL